MARLGVVGAVACVAWLAGCSGGVPARAPPQMDPQRSVPEATTAGTSGTTGGPNETASGSSSGSTSSTGGDSGSGSTSTTSSGSSGSSGAGTTTSGGTTTSTSTSTSTSGTSTGTTGAFVTAAHQPFPMVPNNGGAVLDHPQLVAITYDSDQGRARDEGSVDALVTASWVHDVGAEYGVQSASVAGKVHFSDAAPSTIDDYDIQMMLTDRIQSGAVPAPGASLTEPLYVFFFPVSTTITLYGEKSCQAFGGYHSVATMNGTNLPYAVVATCTQPTATGLSIDQTVEVALSHEVIEAATDPVPETGYAINDATSPWFEIGEVGDLCFERVVSVAGYTFQRVWSNRAAAAGGDPCVPASGVPYFSLSPATSVLDIPAGGRGSVQVTGWSTADVGAWTAGVYPLAGTISPLCNWSHVAMTNGQVRTLDVYAQGAQAGDWALLLLVSSQSSSDFNFWPVLVQVH